MWVLGMKLLVLGNVDVNEIGTEWQNGRRKKEKIIMTEAQDYGFTEIQARANV